jgi:hypothetical protein
MAHLTRLVLISLLVTLACIVGWPDLVSAATQPGAKGDPVHYSDPDTIDIPIILQNGVQVGTASGNPIFSVRANQALAAGTVIQHAGSTLFIERVQISSAGGALTSTATPRIAAGVQGQIIALQGTSATNTYTIHDGAGLSLTTSGSALFRLGSFMYFTYDTTGAVWREMTPLTGAPTTVPLPVRAATTANIASLSGPQTVDGVALTVTTPRQRVLVKNQTTASQNGPYTVETGAWLRALDFDESVEARTNAIYIVEEGLTQETNACRLTTVGAITLGTTALNFNCFGDISVVRPTQTLAAGNTIQHAGRDDIMETIPIIANTGGGVINTATTRIAAGLSGQIIFLQGTSSVNTYTIPDGNGVKWATGSDVTFDDRTSRVLQYSTAITAWRELVTFTGTGGGGGGTAASTSFNPTGTIAGINVQTALAEAASEAEQIANRDANSGYPTLRADGKLKETQIGSFFQHGDLSNASQITVSARQMGLQCASALCDLTNAIQIVAGVANQEVELIGTSTNVVKLDNGNGVRLCGNTGSLIIGLNRAKPVFRYNTVLSPAVWEQINCPSGVQDAFNVNNDLLTGSTAATGFRWGDVPSGNYCTMFFDAANGNLPTIQCFCGGAPCDSVVQLSVGTAHRVKNNVGADLFSVTNAGVITGAATSAAVLMGNFLTYSGNCSAPGQISYTALSGRSPANLGDPEAWIAQPVPRAGTIANLRVQLDTNVPAGQTVVYTVRKNTGGGPASTPVTCSIAAGASTCNSGVLSDTVAAGNRVNLMVTCSGGIGDMGNAGFGVTLQ